MRLVILITHSNSWFWHSCFTYVSSTTNRDRCALLMRLVILITHSNSWFGHSCFTYVSSTTNRGPLCTKIYFVFNSKYAFQQNQCALRSTLCKSRECNCALVQEFNSKHIGSLIWFLSAVMLSLRDPVQKPCRYSLEVGGAQDIVSTEIDKVSPISKLSPRDSMHKILETLLYVRVQTVPDQKSRHNLKWFHCRLLFSQVVKKPSF